MNMISKLNRRALEEMRMCCFMENQGRAIEIRRDYCLIDTAQ